MTVISYDNFRNFSIPDPWNKNLESYRQEKISYKNKEYVNNTDYFPCLNCDNSGKVVTDRDYDPCGRTDYTYGTYQVCKGSGTVDKSTFKFYYQSAKKRHDDYRQEKLLFIRKMETLLSQITKEEYNFLTNIHRESCGYGMDLKHHKVKKKKTPFKK